MPGLISEEDINQVRERNDLIEVVSDHVTLKKKGRLLWGLCPFHNEKTPSFKIDPAMQLWHCFGCGEGGNVFTFLMKVEHLEFPEAVETLADRVGFEITREKEEGPSRSFRQRLYDANTEASQHWSVYLRRNPQAALARDYLKSRGFHIELATKFDIGYAPPGRDDLVKHLASKKFNGEEMVAAGLAVKTERGLKDRFFDRVIFPIRDLKGRIVAFGGRALGGDGKPGGEGARAEAHAGPKYLNSPETPVYHKSSTLYGLHQAKGDIVRMGQALVVEGYTDVMALHAAGFTNAVATCGTAMTADHIKLLGRFTSKIVLVFDADAAGMTAAERGVVYVSEFLPGSKSVADLSSRQQIDLSVAVLPEGQDPADVISSMGAEEFQRLVDGASDLLDFAIDRKVNACDISTSKGRVRAAQEALSLIASLGSPVAREEYLRLIASKIGVSTDSLALELRRIRPTPRRESNAVTRSGDSSPAQRVSSSGSNATRGKSAAAGDASPPDAQTKAETEMLRLALSSAEIRKRAAEADPELFTVSAHRELFGVLSQVSAGNEDVSGPGIVSGLGPDLQSLASGLLLDGAEIDDENRYFCEILARLKEFEVERQIDGLKNRIQKLNRMDGEQLYDSLFGELIALESKRRQLRNEASGGAKGDSQVAGT